MTKSSLFRFASLLLLPIYGCTHQVIDADRSVNPGISVCPEGATGDVRSILGIDIKRGISVVDLKKKLEERKYMPSYEIYYLFRPECWERSLDRTRQLSVTIVEGGSSDGEIVLKRYFFFSDGKGLLTKIEARYIY